MKKSILMVATLLMVMHSFGQEKAHAFITTPKLQDIRKAIIATQENTNLYKQNLASNSEEHDVNSIVKDIEQHLNTPAKTKSSEDPLLNRSFNAIRYFFLTTTNKTAVASSFLYPENPYHFCLYNDTAVVLYFAALKDGGTYNLDKMTERKAMRSVLENCLLPALKATDSLVERDCKYVALSVYYGCKDTRQGAPKDPLTPYCLTLVARLDELQQYEAGVLTEKGLLTNSVLYLSDAEGSKELNKVTINLDQ